MFPKVNPTQTDAWKRLEAHFNSFQHVKMQDLFAKDPLRAARMAIEWEDFYVDYSKNRVSKETMNLLFQFA